MWLLGFASWPAGQPARLPGLLARICLDCQDASLATSRAPVYYRVFTLVRSYGHTAYCM